MNSFLLLPTLAGLTLKCESYKWEKMRKRKRKQFFLPFFSCHSRYTTKLLIHSPIRNCPCVCEEWVNIRIELAVRKFIELMAVQYIFCPRERFGPEKISYLSAAIKGGKFSLWEKNRRLSLASFSKVSKFFFFFIGSRGKKRVKLSSRPVGGLKEIAFDAQLASAAAVQNSPAADDDRL